MKKRILATALIAGSIVAHGAVVTYDFDTDMGDSTSGTELRASTITYAVGTNSDGAPDSSERAWNQTSASGEYELNMGQRGIGNSGITDAALALGAASQLTFTLTPNAGESLDFSASQLDFNASFYNDLNSGNMSFAYKIWADTGAGLQAVGTLQSIALSAAPGTENRLLQTDELTDLPGLSLDDGSIESQVNGFTFDLSTLGAVANDQAVTFAITLSGNRNNQFTWGNSIDEITLSNVVIPEPATLGMLAMVGAGIIFIRRRFMI